MEFTPQSDVPFGSGMAQFDLQAAAYDSNYGTFVTVSKSSTVKLKPSR